MQVVIGTRVFLCSEWFVRLDETSVWLKFTIHSGSKEPSNN